jgi:hypothetical protein
MMTHQDWCATAVREGKYQEKHTFQTEANMCQAQFNLVKVHVLVLNIRTHVHVCS